MKALIKQFWVDFFVISKSCKTEDLMYELLKLQEKISKEINKLIDEA